MRGHCFNLMNLGGVVSTGSMVVFGNLPNRKLSAFRSSAILGDSA